MVDISKAFNTSSEKVSDFFQRPGISFYIPLYQREYSWDKENIDQLIEDICRGVDAALSDDGNIHFLGAIILVTEKNPKANINPRDNRALPSRIDNVIDGQQRISTISLLACFLYQKLYEHKNKLPNDDTYSGFVEAIDKYLRILLEVFSVDLNRGNPTRKPIIIRASVDGWTFDGNDDNYKSDISSFIAAFIRAVEEKTEFPKPPKNSLVGTNLKRINSLFKEVEKAYELNSEGFSPAWKILQHMSEDDLWNYERLELKSLINECKQKVEDKDNLTQKQKRACSLVQMFAFCHYLLERCCFTLIEPSSEDWAFDMFQSLNATGTPLTALETFRPLVVNFVDTNGRKASDSNQNFKGSKSEEYFAKVEQLFSPLKSASSKNKLTNDYLTLFGTTYDGGKKPSRQFTAQRKWLTDKYKECDSSDQKEEFIRRMGDLATYWENVLKFEPKLSSFIPRTQEVDQVDSKLAALCVLYLQDAGHKMAHTILSRFYSLILRNTSQEDKDVAENFVLATKKVAAFFTLWRSALPNTGLDEIYRKLLREQMSWEKGDSQLNTEELKTYFTKILEEKGIGTKNEWIGKAVQYLRYDNAKAVCKFSLFITAHDTIPDPNELGMMKKGIPGSSTSYLEPSQWIAEDLSTIEHIAPQKKTDEGNWDDALYSANDDYEQIGNLTLLPTKINSSASNKGWTEKFIYYQHLAETDPDKLSALKLKADENGINLNDSTIDLLKKASHQHHIKPIVELGEDGKWDKSFVEKRTRCICDILWDRMDEWLSE